MIFPNVKNLREDHDLRQREVAAVLNVSQNTYSQYESGQRQIPIEALIKLAEFYDVSVDYLLNLTDEDTPYKRNK